jgi:hypothetical protein
MSDAALRHAELLAEYPDGYQRHPGKFEGEPIAAMYFHELCLDGAQDETLYDGDTPIDVFRVDADDRALWTLLDSTTHVVCWTQDSGFAMFEELARDQYDRLVEHCEQTEEE